MNDTLIIDFVSPKIDKSPRRGSDAKPSRSKRSSLSKVLDAMASDDSSSPKTHVVKSKKKLRSSVTSLPLPPPSVLQTTAKAALNKPRIVPSSKMKPLHWKRVLLENPEDVVWGKKESVVKISPESIEDSFGEEIKNKKMLRRMSTFKELDMTKIIRILPDKKYNAIAIVLKNLKIALSAIRDAILEMDTAVISIEIVETLLREYPSETEIELLQNCTSKGCLDRPERFMLMLIEIPDLKTLFQMWISVYNLPETIEDAGSACSLIHRASRALRKSDSVATVLEGVLQVGNYLNGNTKRGQADGFELEILSKLVLTKSNDKSGNLLKFVHESLIQSNPEIAWMNDELSIVAVAAKSLTIAEIDDKISAMHKIYTDVSTMVDKCLDDTDGKEESGLLQHIAALSLRCGAAYEKLMHQIYDAKAEYMKTVKYFTSPDYLHFDQSGNFFGLWAKFIRDFTSS